MLRFNLITMFPGMLDSYHKESILHRAEEQKLIQIAAHDLRNYTSDKHHKVDDKPFGGGAGMVLKIEPIYKAVQSLSSKFKMQSAKLRKTSRQARSIKKEKIILLSAKGKQFTQGMARKYAKLDQIIFICGRYEGVDERVAAYIADEEVSIGPYVLTGGELAAMVMTDAISRHVPGVLGNKESLVEESFSSSRTYNLQPTTYNLVREYPQYTRPEVFSPRYGVRWQVPKVLLSGDHKKIAEWRTMHAK